MLNYFCCCRWLYEESDPNFGRVRLAELQEIQLDHNRSGQDVVLVKNGNRICGSGASLATAPINQNKAYFETKIQSSGSWGVGLATKMTNLNTILGNDLNSWVLREDGVFYHNNEVKSRLPEPIPQEGDVLGFTYDHVELNVFLNGKKTSMSITGIKGTVYPTVFVDDNAILDMRFRFFSHDPPEGFEEIMVEQNIL